MVDHTNDQSTGVQSQEGLLHDVDPSLTEANEVAKALDVDTNTGLSSAEAQRRLEKFGPNQLASAPPVPKWKKFLAQFQDPLVYLLLAATVISLIAWFIERSHGTAGEVLPFDAIVIILILIVNAVLGYIQEARAEQAVEALAQMTAPQTSVLRDGKIVHINGGQEARHARLRQGAGRPHQYDFQRHVRHPGHRPRDRDRNRHEHAGRQDRRHAVADR